jgi:hypothetical protein
VAKRIFGAAIPVRRNELAGCALAQSGTGPSFCTNAIPMDPGSNRNNVGLGALPVVEECTAADSREWRAAMRVQHKEDAGLVARLAGFGRGKPGARPAPERCPSTGCR